MAFEISVRFILMFRILAEEYSREGAILIISDMMPEDAGLYMCIAENHAGVEESVASITVLGIHTDL